jgi:DNA-binding NarL/FixJ family response regulator
MMRDVVTSALDAEDIEVVAAVPTHAEALAELARLQDHIPHVAVLEVAGDHHRPSVEQAAARHLVLVISDEAAPDKVLALLEVGASGFLLQDIPTAWLPASVRELARGGVVLQPAISALVLDQWRRLRAGAGLLNHRVRPLTPREKEILGYVAQGMSAKHIASELGVTLKTIENHKIRIFDKLGARTQAEAAYLAISQGLVSHT